MGGVWVCVCVCACVKGDPVSEARAERRSRCDPTKTYGIRQVTNSEAIGICDFFL